LNPDFVFEKWRKKKRSLSSDSGRTHHGEIGFWENVNALGKVDLEMVPELVSLAVWKYSGARRAAHLPPSGQLENSG